MMIIIIMKFSKHLSEIISCRIIYKLHIIFESLLLQCLQVSFEGSDLTGHEVVDLHEGLATPRRQPITSHLHEYQC